MLAVVFIYFAFALHLVYICLEKQYFAFREYTFWGLVAGLATNAYLSHLVII